MLGITPFGMAHTVISLVAVAAGVVALARLRRDQFPDHARPHLSDHDGPDLPDRLLHLPARRLRQAACTGHTDPAGDGYRVSAERGNWFGRLSAYVSVVGYSMTLFFHMIPAITETATRVPPSQPLAAGPEAQVVQASAWAWRSWCS